MYFGLLPELTNVNIRWVLYFENLMKLLFVTSGRTGPSVVQEGMLVVIVLDSLLLLISGIRT